MKYYEHYGWKKLTLKELTRADLPRIRLVENSERLLSNSSVFLSYLSVVILKCVLLIIFNNYLNIYRIIFADHWLRFSAVSTLFVISHSPSRALVHSHDYSAPVHRSVGEGRRPMDSTSLNENIFFLPNMVYKIRLLTCFLSLAVASK